MIINIEVIGFYSKDERKPTIKILN